MGKQKEFTKDLVCHKVVFRSICILADEIIPLLGKSKSQAIGVYHLSR